MTVNELRQEILPELRPVVGDSEATAMMREIFRKLKGYNAVDIVLNADKTVLPESVAHTREWIERVKQGEPFQYVLGSAPFMGMELKVTPAVLIPRPETAQLVELITDRYRGRQDLTVLDVGTGSGCIAIALARALPFAAITAIDISDDALKVAQENAKALKAGNVEFKKADALKLASAGLPEPFDIIVSNPPYIAEREKADMDARVYDHEPEQALFVPDDNPLIFYKAIADYAIDGGLKSGGALFFEINPLFAEDLRAYLLKQAWRSVDIIADYKGKQRFAVAVMR